MHPIILAIIAVSVLLLGAKLLAELFARLNLPVVLGELTAGIILGPFYFGGLVQIQPSLVEVNDIVLAFAQIGGIVILFVAGLGMPFSRVCQRWHRIVHNGNSGSTATILRWSSALCRTWLWPLREPNGVGVVCPKCGWSRKNSRERELAKTNLRLRTTEQSNR